MTHLSELHLLERQLEQELRAATDYQTFQALKIKYFGKKGLMTQQYKAMHLLPPEQRQERGAQLNSIKATFFTAFNAACHRGKTQPKASAVLDMHLPAPKDILGALHPLTLVTMAIKDFFRVRGFLIVEHTAEIETTQCNFDALNIASDHPSRDARDTFYLSETRVLRTHTSPAQLNIMQCFKPPLAVLVPGAVYRRDQDKTHTPMFHQIEGFVINEVVTWMDLLDVIQGFIQAFFGEDIEVRFRPSYFPFTEPSLEVDIKKAEQWIEVLGCGMIHPQVLTNMQLDPAVFQGFAFGLGIERLAMLKYGVEDLSIFYKNNLWFLQQFSAQGAGL